MDSSKKAGCGMVCFNSKHLLLFADYGPPPKTSNPEQYLQEIPCTLMVEAHSLYMHKYTSIIEGALYHSLLVHTHTYTPSLFPRLVPILKIIVNNFARLNKKTGRSLGTRLYIPTPTHTYTHTHKHTHTNHTCSDCAI